MWFLCFNLLGSAVKEQSDDEENLKVNLRQGSKVDDAPHFAL